MTSARDLLRSRPEGLCCPEGQFFIDPVRPVERALITHGHADHARAGHGAVLATKETLDIMRLRYGEGFAGTVQEARPDEAISINGMRITFHPAGHVLGSAQIAVEANGARIVASGDYKRSRDPTCAPFEPIPCDVFITEATFALPVFTHPDPTHEVGQLLTSLKQFPERTHIVGAYTLGKAQRVIALLREAGYGETIYIHGALAKLCAYYESTGVPLGPLQAATVEEEGEAPPAGTVVVAPPAAIDDRWSRRFADPLACFASGWMRIRQRARQRGVELPLIISDHADWNELTDTIRETGAGEVWVTHGREEALVRWCELNGIMAKPLHLAGYEDEAE
ncbi:ligase-associated DNA damage response exonuclease [Chelativorans salis]|uniref:Ligase-associated DNA damage response exonuclease n=1 Tax=Chelativorans salis TaxID=2978478 RepID=A0ABT2LIS7_9HYPH|nr:ligase-associated DNA damage response exonuclease [Chelativorans sp. EGI FJ00035]MCT7374481.1 ligase-associated DNA damage response exonuclease [Chelativorans sp. EGI FJ00035]